MNRLMKILEHGQSIWLDLLDRKLMDSGELQRLIDEDGLRGLTSNPAIFEKAISNSTDYDEDIKMISTKNDSDEAIFFSLAIKDIQRAADFFKPVYKGTNGNDGFVSLEVSPFLARDTDGTIRQAKELWKKIDRRNVMIKIPGTEEGLPAIRQCIADGININITLLFGLPRYKKVTEAYMGGLEDRLNSDKPIDHVSSVASFFLSRIDAMIDPILEEKGLEKLKGKTAIASAKKAYQIYMDMVSSERFKALEAHGAKRQRVLWASTSTKNPSYSDVKYVEALIGKETVNTVPLKTLDAFKDHGNVTDHLTDKLDEATKVLEQLSDHGIDLDNIAQKLEEEGIGKFNAPFEKLLKGIARHKKKQER